MIDSSARADDEDESSGERQIEPSTSDAVEPDEVVEGEIEQDRRLSRPTSFTGPLPPPHVLEEYDEVVPGLKHDIVDQWKAETAHRHRTIDGMRETDHQAMQAYYGGEKRGQYLGFVILVGVLIVAGLSVALGEPVVGVASLVMAAAAAIWALRRSSLGDGAGPTDIGNGDDVEQVTPRSEDEA